MEYFDRAFSTGIDSEGPDGVTDTMLPDVDSDRGVLAERHGNPECQSKYSWVVVIFENICPTPSRGSKVRLRVPSASILAFNTLITKTVKTHVVGNRPGKALLNRLQMEGGRSTKGFQCHVITRRLLHPLLAVAGKTLKTYFCKTSAIIILQAGKNSIHLRPWTLRYPTNRIFVFHGNSFCINDCATTM